jgi:hypothetical protein
MGETRMAAPVSGDALHGEGVTLRGHEAAAYSGSGWSGRLPTTTRRNPHGAGGSKGARETRPSSLRPRGAPNPRALVPLVGNPDLAAAALFVSLEAAVLERARHLQGEILAMLGVAP